MNQKVPVPVARYHITDKHAEQLAQHTGILSWGGQGVCVTGSALCFWKMVMYFFGGFGNPYGDWAFYIGSFIFLSILSYAILNNCFIAIWRETSGFHMRMQEKHFKGYVYSNVSWIDLAGSMFSWWVNTDNLLAKGSLVVLLLTNVGGGMVTMNPWADLIKTAGAFGVSLLVSCFVVYIAINFTITKNHLKSHATEWRAHIEKPEVLSLAEVKQRHNQLPKAPGNAGTIKAMPNNPRLRSGNTITGEILEEQEEEVV